MNRLVRVCMQSALVAGGLVVAGAAAANATSEPAPDLHSHKTINAPVKAAVDASRTAIAVLGKSESTSKGSSVKGSGTAVSRATAGAYVPAKVDLGHHAKSKSSSSTSSSKANHKVVNAPVKAPVSVNGTSVAVLGKAKSSQSQSASSGPTSTTSDSSPTAGDSPVLANTKQAVVSAPINVPVNVCGTSVAVLGKASSDCGSGSSPTTGSGSASSDGSLVNAPITVPVDVCGTSVGVLGSSSATCADGGDSTPANPGGEDPVTPVTPGEEPQDPQTPVTPQTPGTPGTLGTPDPDGTPGVNGGQGVGGAGTAGSPAAPNTGGSNAAGESTSGGGSAGTGSEPNPCVIQTGSSFVPMIEGIPGSTQAALGLLLFILGIALGTFTRNRHLRGAGPLA